MSLSPGSREEEGDEFDQNESFSSSSNLSRGIFSSFYPSNNAQKKVTSTKEEAYDNDKNDLDDKHIFFRDNKPGSTYISTRPQSDIVTSYTPDMRSFFQQAFIDLGSDGPEAFQFGEQEGDALDIMVRELIENEFPVKDQVPSMKDLFNVGSIEPNRPRYAPGEWVEIEGPDMKWRLDMITRVLKQAPNDWDWNDPKNKEKEPTWTFTYNAGDKRDIAEEDLRSSEEGLKKLFGFRPWVWQQWATLKLEQKIRFQEKHQDDFIELDIQEYAASLWDQWLDHPSNYAFRKLFFDKRIGELGRTELVDHIQAPFRLMDLMTEENEEWDFEDNEEEGINVFTYLSLLGTGVVVFTLIVGIQFLIPCILVIEVNGISPCEEENENLAKVVSILIFVYYLFSVVPRTYSKFYNVAGTANTVYSRLNSMRRELWEQNDDRFLQMIGYKVDQYMNSGYECLIYMLNIYVLLKTGSAIEVVLNSIAFKAISNIDEEVARLPWWDPDRRWITAGGVSMVMETTIRARYLSSPTLFSRHFGVTEEKVLKACDNDPSLLMNMYVSKDDSECPKYLSKEEQILLRCSKVAEKLGNKQALAEYKKSPAFFGVIDTMFGNLCQKPGHFERFRSLRTWSRWEKCLFLSPIPDLDELFDRVPNEEKWKISRHLEEIMPTKQNPFANFTTTNDESFLLHCLQVLVFWNLPKSIKPSWHDGKYFRLFFRIGDAFIEWISCALHIAFPIYLGFAFADSIYQLMSEDCETLFNKLFGI